MNISQDDHQAGHPARWGEQGSVWPLVRCPPGLPGRFAGGWHRRAGHGDQEPSERVVDRS